MAGLFNTLAADDATYMASSAENAARAEAAANAAQQSADDAAASAASISNSVTQAAGSASAAATSAAAAATSANTASTKASEAAASAAASEASAVRSENAYQDMAVQIDEAKSWAIKEDGPVEGTDYSSKYNANQSASSATASQAQATISTQQATLSRDWATKTSGPVEGANYSAKYYSTASAASATASASSANSASTSASTANAAATTATNQATQAGTSAVSAASSANSATISAGSASSSATSAANSASTASTQATISATKASEASTSASNADASATTASNAAINASTSATTASNAVTQTQADVASASSSATAASISAQSAQFFASGAENSKDFAKDWAIKMDGPVLDSEYSAKYWATQAGSTVSGVSSFNTRSGFVMPEAGDYTVAQVTGAVPNTLTINGKALTGNIVLSTSDIDMTPIFTGDNTWTGYKNRFGSSSSAIEMNSYGELTFFAYGGNSSGDARIKVTNPNPSSSQGGVLSIEAAKIYARSIELWYNPLAITSGGTGATNASSARTNLGIGSAGTRDEYYFARVGSSNTFAGNNTFNDQAGFTSSVTFNVKTDFNRTINFNSDFYAKNSIYITNSSNSGSTMMYQSGSVFRISQLQSSNSSYNNIAFDTNEVAFTTGGSGQSSKTLTLSPTSLSPYVLDSLSLGTLNLRYSTVYATTGTINTSDARLKTEVRAFSTEEIAAAQEISKEIGFFKWLDRVEVKGDDAREHCGLTVQKAIAIMESHGLNPLGYGFICHDTWEKKVDFEGTPDEVVVYEAGEMYSFRFDQLNLFIARGQEARLAAIEARLNAM